MGQLQKHNICLMGMPEREERGIGTEEIFETIMLENFPKLMSDYKSQIQEAQRTPRKKNAPKSISRHIIFKLQKITDK